jgi:Ethanolamine utilization protein EutJ (predicted chaperonin)
VKKTFLNFLAKGGGHVTLAAILDYRIFPEKSEEKKDIKKLVSKLFFQLKSMDKQVMKNNHYFIYIDTCY